MTKPQIEQLISDWLINEEGHCNERYRERIRGLCSMIIRAVEAELKDQIPPVGSGPWAIMQSQRGRRVQYGDMPWEANICEPPPSIRCRLIEPSGWSVVPDAKPMTFAEAFDRIDSGKRARFDGDKFVLGEKHRIGKWFAC